MEPPGANPLPENSGRGQAHFMDRLLSLTGTRTSSFANLAGGLIVFALIAAAGLTVYASGGTRFAYVHSAYVPILVAAYFFGLRGGLISSLVAGVLMGPVMPLDVALGTAQGGN